MRSDARNGVRFFSSQWANRAAFSRLAPLSSLLRPLLQLTALAFIGFTMAASCGEADVLLAAIGGECVLDSDCDGELVCTFRRCHQACVTTADCEPGQRCVEAEANKVCLLDAEASCAANSDCPAPLACAPDARCRNQCLTDPDCIAGQLCSRQRACAEPGELDGGLLPDTTPGDDPCLASSDCDPPTLCEAGRCLLECVRDEDCASGRCVESRCAAGGPVGVDCVPGAQLACTCSDGSPGVWLCNADGTVFGPDCLGCPTTTTVTDCPPMAFPDAAIAGMVPLAFSSSATATGMAVNAVGETILVGYFVAPTDFGDGNLLTPLGALDSFVAIYDAAGALVSAQPFGVVGGTVEAVAAADDPVNGDVWIAGSYQGTPDLGGGPLAGPRGAFVIRLSDTGVVLDTAGWPTTGANSVFNLALSVGVGGGATLAGTYEGTLDVGGQMLTLASATTQEMFLAKVSPAFTVEWAKSFPASGVIAFPPSTSAALSAPSGDVYFAGRLTGQIDFGDGLPLAGTGEGFVARYDALGALQWVRTFGALPPQWLSELSASQLLAWGDQSNGADLGQGALPTGPYRATLSVLDGSTTESAASALHPIDESATGDDLSVAFTSSNSMLTAGECTVALTQYDTVFTTGPFLGHPSRVRVFSHPSAGFGFIQPFSGAIGADGSASLLLSLTPAVTNQDFGAGAVSGDTLFVHITPPP